MRVVAFSAVIAVHSIAFTESPSNVVAAGGLMALQFGREVFFALTGFVLVFSLGERDLHVLSFWRRRLSLVALPFVTWSVVYYAFDVISGASFSSGAFLGDLLTGNADYHLYFLLVTVQLYLAFPVVLRLVRRTASHPWMVLSVVGALNVAWLAALQYSTAPAGVGWLWTRAYELLPTYAVWVLAGCYAAVHWSRVERAARRWRHPLVFGGVGCVAVAEVIYVLQLATFTPRDAAAVLQPATALMCVGVLMILLVMTGRWATRRPDGSPVLRTASDISFGVYLSHPLVLAVLVDAGLGSPATLPVPMATAVGIIVPAAAAGAFTLAVRRTRLSILLTGRPRRPRPQSLTQLPAGFDGVLSRKEERTRYETTIDRSLAPLVPR